MTELMDFLLCLLGSRLIFVGKIHSRDESTVEMNVRLLGSLDEPIGFLKLICWSAYEPPIVAVPEPNDSEIGFFT